MGQPSLDTSSLVAETVEMVVAYYCCYCILSEPEVALGSPSSSLPYIAVAVVVVGEAVGGYCTCDFVENRDPLLLEIDSDTRLSLWSM